MKTKNKKKRKKTTRVGSHQILLHY